MTINEKKQLTNYIKGLVRESIQEVDMPRWHNELYGINDEDYEDEDGAVNDESFDEPDTPDAHDDFWEEMGHEQPERHYEGPDVTSTDYDEFGSPAYSKSSVNEKRILSNYIKNLVRESIGELRNRPELTQKEFDDVTADGFDEFDDDYGDDDLGPVPSDFSGMKDNAELMGRSESQFDLPNDEESDYDDEEEDNEIAGINELRQLAESYARESVSQILSESKKKKKGKRKNKKEKTSSKDKTVVSQLNADGTNAAHYFYKLYGVENGTDAEKAAARSKGYKKAKGKKNDTGVPYKFNSKERNRLSSLLTDRG